MSEELYNESVKKFTTDGGEIMMFYVDERLFGFDISYITEIIQMQPLTYVPKVPDYISGVINIRGKVVPVISIRKKFGEPEIEYNRRNCIIVVDIGDFQAGLIVDNIREVSFVSPDSLCKTPDFKNVNASRYIQSILDYGEDTVMLLHIRKLVLD
ncbi:MAG: chemotaxis protein CheW [Oscillospiraceae bacterium]